MPQKTFRQDSGIIKGKIVEYGLYMRFFFVVFIFYSFLALPAYAIDQRVSMGLVFGMTTNNAGGQDIENLYLSSGVQVPGSLSTNLIGGNLGLFVQYQLPQYYFALQLDTLIFFNRGVNYIDPTDNDFRAKISAHEFAIILLAQAIIPTTDSIRFSISVGPMISVPMSGFLQTYHNSKTGERDRFNFTTKPFSYGIVAGIGLQIDLGPGFFVIDGRFAMDFSPFIAERDISLNTPITLQVGYAIDLWKGEKR
ncbi:MAG: outer membrane beta-barrel protein [Spirochaetia bacterium]